MPTSEIPSNSFSIPIHTRLRNNRLTLAGVEDAVFGKQLTNKPQFPENASNEQWRAGMEEHYKITLAILAEKERIQQKNKENSLNYGKPIKNTGEGGRYEIINGELVINEPTKQSLGIPVSFEVSEKVSV